MELFSIRIRRTFQLVSTTIVFILPLHLDYTKVIILILWWRNFQLEYWRTFQLVSTYMAMKDKLKMVPNITNSRSFHNSNK